MLFTSCSTPFVKLTSPTTVEIDWLFESPHLKTSSEFSRVDFMGLDEDMRRFAQRWAGPYRGKERRLQELVHALISPGLLGIRYDETAILTAREVFDVRRANCLSFSGLFVAMARDQGLPAYFQEVDTPYQWDQLREGVIILYRHVNVVVPLKSGEQIVDMQLNRYKPTYPRRRISDQRALSLFYNNIAAQNLFQENYSSAFEALHKGIQIDPQVAINWSNLGFLFGRVGDSQRAEISYRQALAVKPNNPSAMNNLANIYEKKGESNLARQLFAASRRHRLRNPYYRYALAQKAYREADYLEALDLILNAINLKDKEPLFYRLLAKVYAAKGEGVLERQSLDKAAVLAENEGGGV
ncbi:MAG: tetratricopeptide repeat protein [Pseudomonadales bacterium]